MFVNKVFHYLLCCQPYLVTIRLMFMWLVCNRFIFFLIDAWKQSLFVRAFYVFLMADKCNKRLLSNKSKNFILFATQNGDEVPFSLLKSILCARHLFVLVSSDFKDTHTPLWSAIEKWWIQKKKKPKNRHWKL